MQFNKLSFKAVILTLAGITSSMAAGIAPLTFGNASTDAENWNYLVNFKMWGQTGVSFGDNNRFPNEAGWIGTAKDLTFRNDDRIAGALIVGGSIMSNNHTRLTTGPVRYGGTISSQLEINGTKCQGTTTAGDCADVPQYRTKLTIPKMTSWPTNMGSISIGNKMEFEIDARDQTEFYYNSISLGDEGKLIIKMPAGGRVTRIFTKSLNLDNHPHILVQYEGESTPRCNTKVSNYTCGGDYEGNLLIFVDDDITFRNSDYLPIDGTIISTGKISVVSNMAFAGQLLAKEIVVDNNVKGDGFQFVPFVDLPVLALNSKAATFEENNTWQTIKIGLDKEIENDVTFKYCFKFNSQAVAGLYASKDDVADADASHDFPVCGEGSPATATILKGTIYPSKDIYIKPLIDGRVETSTTDGEKLWLVISDVTGAKISTENYDESQGGFNIFITDVDKLPSVSKELIVNVHEDEKHTFTASEFNFQHATQSFASVIISGLPTAGTLTYNETAVTKDQVISVADLSKLTYKAAANDYGNNYTTFKYKVVGNGTEQNTSAEYTATVNVLPVNDKPSVSDVTFIVGEQSHTVSGGPIEVTDVSNERNKDTYTYTLVNVSGSDYTAFNSTFEIVKLNDQNATIKVKNSATLDYNQKSEYVVYATVTDDASTETSTIAGPLTSAQFKITVKISDEPETITQESKILPLTFGSGNGAEENDNWNYLVNYKIWGETGVSFGNGATFINEAGWIGTANNLTFRNDARIAGALIVGGSITSNNHTRLTKGQVRYGGTISSQLEINGTKCQGTTTAGDCADVPQYRTKLTIPKMTSWPTNMGSISIGNKMEFKIDARTQSDLYYSSITLANDSKLIVRMPAGGRPTRIFTRSLTLNAHPQILVQYDNEANPRCIAKSSTIPCNGEYEGNLLIYVDGNIDFRYADFSSIDGTFISTETISVARNMAFAGQLLAKKINIDDDAQDDDFQFVPFKELPALVLSSKSATFEENDTWQTIKIGLDNESESDVTFNYCFGFNSQAVSGLYASKDDVAAADASHNFPVCGEGTPATATIPKGKIYPSKDIYIKPLIDGLVENSTTDGEKLWLVISDVTGAKLSTDNYDNAKGGFNIFITDVNKQPGVTKELVVNVNEDEKHTFTASEFNFQHESQSFVSVIITALPTAGTLTYNGAAVTKGQVIDVANLGKLTYQPKANDFGDNYATFKYKVVGSGTSDNTSTEYTATINVAPVNDKPTVADVTFTVGDRSHSVSGGPITVTDVSNEIDVDTYTYTLDATSADYSAFNSTFEIVPSGNGKTATIKVKTGAVLDYSQKKEYVVQATVTDDASTETSKVAGPLTSDKFTITVKIEEEPETIAQESRILPLTFGSGSGAEENDNWNYLINYKIWGQTGVSFGNNNRILNEAGWIGSANGNLTSTGNDAQIAGAVIVGGSIQNTGKMALTTGPVRYGGSISDGSRVSGTKCQGTTTAGDCADVPLYRTTLTVPTMTSWPSNLKDIYMPDHGTYTIDARSGSADLYFNSINFGQESRLLVLMPAGGRVTRIFAKKLNISENTTHPQIVVQYEGEQGPRCHLANGQQSNGKYDCSGGDYEGNLVIYVDDKIYFRSVDYSPIDGTIISTGTIAVESNMSFAGQLIANNITIEGEVKGDGFQFVPFNAPPALTLSNKNATFPESDKWETIKIGLDKESETDVTFKYCFRFNGQDVSGFYAGTSDVAPADASHDFPVCGTSGAPLTATIPKGKLYPSKDINIKPLIDGLVETSTSGGEKLWLVISDVRGAIVSTDNYDESKGGFNLFITDVDKQPTVTKELVINVNEDAKHAFTENEFNFSHATQTFSSVIISGLPTAGTLTYDGTAVSKDQVIDVADLGKLAYQPKANEFGNNYATFKYKVVSSGSGDNTSIEYTATVNVISVNDKPTVADATFTVNELDHSVTGGPITVTDVSNEIDVDTYTYTLDATSADYSAFNSTFEIVPSGNGKTATLKVKSDAVIDYGKKKEYVVYATVKDNASTEAPKIAGSLTSDKFTITVKIEEENTDPVIANQTFTIPEKNTDGTDWPSGKTIGNVVASDPDDNELSFTVVTTDVPFKFNNNTKELVVTDGSILDFETKTTWTFTVKVEDGQGGEATAQITIDIEDVLETEIYVNDEGATVISGIASAGTAIENITENSDESTQAQLNEITSEITYAVSEGTSTNATEYFDIDEHGDITAKEDLVFEALYNGNEDNPGNEFTFVITASGTNSKDEPVSTNITKKIIIADVNEQPVIKTEEPIDVPETALSNGEVVGKIDAIDPDSCSFNPNYACREGSHPQGFNKLTYTIDEILEVDGSTDFPFEIDPNTGVITFRQGPSLIRQYRYNYTAIVSRVNEPNNTRQRRYEFIVKVTDGSTDPRNPPKSVKKKIVLNITETAHISSSSSGTSTSSSSEISSSSVIASSSSSAETITSSGSIKPESSSATVASSGSIKPESSSATVASSGSIKPESSSATVASSGSIKPESSSATVASSGSIKPESSSATIASSGSIKPESSSATVASSGSVKPESSSATVASSGSVKPESSSATVASSGSVKPESSSATVASSGSVKPKSSSAKASSSESSKPESSSDKKTTSSSSSSRNDVSSSSNNEVKSSSSKATSSSSRNSEYDAPTFYVRMTGAFEFEIVMDESLPSLAKQYAVMDMKGQVISIGELNEKGAHVKVPTSGAYIVRIGLGYRRVNVR